MEAFPELRFPFLDDTSLCQVDIRAASTALHSCAKMHKSVFASGDGITSKDLETHESNESIRHYPLMAAAFKPLRLPTRVMLWDGVV